MGYHLSFVTFPPQFSQKLIDFLLLLFRLSSLNMIVAILVDRQTQVNILVCSQVSIFPHISILVCSQVSNFPHISILVCSPPLGSAPFLPLAPLHSRAARGVQLVPATSRHLGPGHWHVECLVSTIMVRIVVVQSLKTITHFLYTHIIPL